MQACGRWYARHGRAGAREQGSADARAQASGRRALKPSDARQARRRADVVAQAHGRGAR